MESRAKVGHSVRFLYRAVRLRASLKRVAGSRALGLGCWSTLTRKDDWYAEGLSEPRLKITLYPGRGARSRIETHPGCASVRPVTVRERRIGALLLSPRSSRETSFDFLTRRKHQRYSTASIATDTENTLGSPEVSRETVSQDVFNSKHVLEYLARPKRSHGWRLSEGSRATSLDRSARRYGA
jgi:hypothetical protein